MTEPVFVITRIVNDEQGESHFDQLTLPLADGGPIGLLSEALKTQSAIFRQTPGDYDFQWHPAPQRQLMFITRGEVDITVSTNKTRRFGPGAVILLEDTDGKGHCSKAVNGEIRQSIFVTLDPETRF